MAPVQPEDSADLDRLVGEMLEMGPENVSRPAGMSQHDFDNIRLVIDKVASMYHPAARHVPCQPGLQKGNRDTLMDLLRAGDYHAAHRFLAVEADFLPA